MNPLSWERSFKSSSHSSNDNETFRSSNRSSNKSSNRSFKSSSRQSNRSSVPSKLELLAIGYGCKLFNDEEQARYLEKGKNLIPFDGDNNLLIDRFDVRSYLNSIDLQKYETKIDTNFLDQLTDDEIELERKLDKERYQDLFAREEENKREEINHEEELKRLKQCIDEDNKKYNQIQFDYSNLEQNDNKEDNYINKAFQDDDDDDEYIVPNGLIDLPDNIKQPTSMKEHNLIEKTAKFISKQGVQMEILLKTKQSSNSQFDFLNYDSPLNPYYKFIVQSIANGTYKSTKNETEQSNQQHTTTDESDDEGYLHPSLLSSHRFNKQISSSIPSNNFKASSNSLYSKLAENLKDKIVVNDKSCYEPKVIESKAVRYESKVESNVHRDQTRQDNKRDINNACDNKKEKKDSVKSIFDLMPEIPPEIKLIIEKLAQYVCKNGDEFEKSVKNRSESRFEFLNPGHKFHFYYVKTKLKLLEEKRKQEESQSKKSMIQDLSKNNASSTNSIATVQINNSNLPENSSSTNNSDSINSKGIQQFMIKTKKQITTFKEDLEAKKLKEKQEERKRKAALFLNKLRQQKNSDNNDESLKNESIDYQIIGPQLPLEQQKEISRNTPSPLRESYKEFMNNLDPKNVKEFKQMNLFDELKKEKIEDDEIQEKEQFSTFKSVKTITRQLRMRDNSGSSDESIKNRRASKSKSPSKLKRSLNRESYSPDHRKHRSRYHSRSPSTSRHKRKRTPHRSRSRDHKSRNKSRDRHERSRDRHRRSRNRSRERRSRDRKSRERS